MLSAKLAADRSAQVLLLSNLFVAVLALVQHWNLLELIWVYWWQNIIVGFFNWRRIVNLRQFSTGGLKMNGRLVQNTPETQKSVARFFLFHYGLFHFIYLIFIFSISDEIAPERLNHATIGLTIFLVNHLFSYRYNRQRDNAGKPNIGTIMFFPYARVVPMHLVLILGVMLSQDSMWALLIFLLLKTGADLIMHLVQHRINPAGAKPQRQVDSASNIP